MTPRLATGTVLTLRVLLLVPKTVATLAVVLFTTLVVLTCILETVFLVSTVDAKVTTLDDEEVIVSVLMVLLNTSVMEADVLFILVVVVGVKSSCGRMAVMLLSPVKSRTG